jgi:hypothetical protein
MGAPISAIPALAYYRNLLRFNDTSLARALGYLLLVFAVFTMLVTARIVIETHTPVMFGDQWVIVDDLLHNDGEILTGRLWVQHNEHRIPLGRLASYADLLLFGGRNTFLLGLIFAIQLAHFGILVTVLRKFGPPEPLFLVPATALCLFCLFSPIQMENFMWGFQTQFVLVTCAASLAFFFAVQQARTPGHLTFAALIAAGWLAELSLSNGVLVWPILSLAAFGLLYSRRSQIQLAAIGAVSVAIYFYAYRTPFYHTNPLKSLLHPIAVAKFVVTYLGFSLDATLPNPSAWPTASESIVVIALVWTISGVVRCFLLRRAGFSALEQFCYASILFVAGSAAITALGRLQFGPAQSTASRYQSLALLFWACTGVLILTRFAKVETSRALAGCEAVLLIIFVAGASRFAGAETYARDRQTAMTKGYTALARNTNDREAMKLVFPSPEALIAYYTYLTSHNLGPDPREFGATEAVAAAEPHRVRPQTDAPQLKGYHLVAPEGCWGFLDEGTPVSGNEHAFTIFGWAWDRAGARVPAKVVLASPNGSVVQSAEFGEPRPDVQKALPEVTSLGNGWKTTLQVAPGAKLRAYAIFADQKTACPLNNEFVAP